MKKLHSIYILLLPIFFSVSACAKEEQSNSFTNQVGNKTNIVNTTATIEIAKLKVINAATATKNIFNSNKNIVGYPVIDKTSLLNTQHKEKLIKILTNNKSYISLRNRCKNSHFIGIRFSKTKEKIEFALGIPCNQAIWAIATEKQPNVWGAVLNNDAANIIKTLTAIN